VTTYYLEQDKWAISEGLDSYTIKDSANTICFTAKNKLPNRFNLHDANGRTLATLKSRLVSMRSRHPSFDIYQDGVLSATVVYDKSSRWYSMNKTTRHAILGPNWFITGDEQNKVFDICDMDGGLHGRITRTSRFTIQRFTIEIEEGEPEILILSLAVFLTRMFFTGSGIPL
jgi:uncharacterized protein YxjI